MCSSPATSSNRSSNSSGIQVWKYNRVLKKKTQTEFVVQPTRHLCIHLWQETWKNMTKIISDVNTFQIKKKLKKNTHRNVKQKNHCLTLPSSHRLDWTPILTGVDGTSTLLSWNAPILCKILGDGVGSLGLAGNQRPVHDSVSSASRRGFETSSRRFSKREFSSSSILSVRANRLWILQNLRLRRVRFGKPKNLRRLDKLDVRLFFYQIVYLMERKNKVNFTHLGGNCCRISTVLHSCWQRLWEMWRRRTRSRLDQSFFLFQFICYSFEI